MAAAVLAATLILGGAYFVGYVSEIQRDLKDPASIRKLATAQIATIEKSLGYSGFLKDYRNYRLTGDAASLARLKRNAEAAARAIDDTRTLYAGNADATDAVREAASVTDAFAHIVAIAPSMGEVALRGTPAMDALNALPQSPQLEATYLTLRSALDRLRQAELEHQLGGAASALNWSQMLLVAAIGFVVLGLLVVAGLLQLGIIQPLKSLERSLVSVGDGAFSQKIWGTERADEFGALARAGEKVRRGLAETSALKELADKGQLHVTLEGQASVLFEKLANDVSTATAALKTASSDILRMQDESRRQFDTTVQQLGRSGAGIDDVAKSLRQGATAAIDDVRASTIKLMDATSHQSRRIDEIAGRFDQGSRKLDEAVAAASAKTTFAVGELAASSASIKRVAGDAQQIQAALFTACDKISSDAANTTENVRTLAARLSDAVGAVDARLSQKLQALDALEQGLTATLANLRTRTDETVAAVKAAAGTLDERGAATQARMTRTVSDFEEVLRLFRDDETALQRSSAQSIEELKETQRSGAAQTQNQLSAAIERLNEVAGQLQAPAHAPELESLAKTLQQQSDSIRSEIRDLAVRLTEDRLLAASDSPFFASNGAAPNLHTPSRTLADVPGAEIMNRLKNLAEEMNATQSRLDHAASLKAALGTFAAEVKALATNADRAARLKSMGKALDRHADEIEAYSDAIDPSAGALRGEVHAITSELRTIAARAQSNGVKEGPALREAAIHLGTRAESLFAYFEHAPESSHVVDEDDGSPAESIDAAAADLSALAQLIGRIESRAEHLSKAALAARFASVSDTLSPAERETHGRNAELKADGAINAVFESIERLNNVAAALARATDVDRQRRAAH